MNDLAASIGLVQLKKLDLFNKKKLLLIKKYNEFIKFDQRIRALLPFKKNCSYWLYGIRSLSRDKLIAYLKSYGIECGVHFLPMSKQPLFKKYSNKLPISESVWKEFITLPLHYDMSVSDVKYISNKINEFGKKIKK